MTKSDSMGSAVATTNSDIWTVFSNDEWYAAFNETQRTCYIAKCMEGSRWTVPRIAGVPCNYDLYLQEHIEMDQYVVVYHGTLDEL